MAGGGKSVSDAVIVAVIGGAFSIVCAIITGVITSNKTIHQMDIKQAVTDERISELTREVRMHNNFAQRMSVVEEKIEEVTRRIDEYHT